MPDGSQALDRGLGPRRLGVILGGETVQRVEVAAIGQAIGKHAATARAFTEQIGIGHVESMKEQAGKRFLSR